MTFEVKAVTEKPPMKETRYLDALSLHLLRLRLLTR